MSSQAVGVEDILSSALSGQIVPNREYLLQGSILDSACDVLLHRLRGLCDNVENGPENFQEHEIVFTLPPMSGASQPGAGPGQQPLTFRIRRALDQGPDQGAAPIMLRYVGNTEMGDKNRQTVVRTCIDVACSREVVEFLRELGFQLEYEVMLKGFLFRKGRMKITVTKACKFPQGPGPKHPDGLEPISNSHLVELSVVAAMGQDAIGDEMKAFAEQLRPLVQLEKFDPRSFPVVS